MPAAVDALLTILRAAPALEGIRIADGPEAVNLTAKHRIHVGWQPRRQRGRHAGAVLERGRRPHPRRDVLDRLLRGIPVGRQGHGPSPREGLRERGGRRDGPARHRYGTRGPDGTVLWAELTAGDLPQAQSEGAIAGLAFTVTCQARI
ncbi:hypothetical protein ACFC09_32140 [Streptomyces sp. NPDC056161]|uniref:hypothetical protein n=1 Tax=Streptomyces sp. NPDC056161 TaxID=3345732 RepID=UPI0035D936E2